MANDQAGDSIVPDRLEPLYVRRLISACCLPFRLVESPEFRALLSYLNDDVKQRSKKIKQIIQAAKSRIHISCDLWTSPNCLAILGIVSHYVTEDGQLEHHTLALNDIDNSGWPKLDKY